MTWHVDEVPQLKGYVVEWVQLGLAILSRKHRLYQAETPTSARHFIGEVQSSGMKKFAANIRLGQRLGRFMVYNAIPLADGITFVTFDKQIGLISKGKYRPLDGLARPFRVLRGACATGKDGAVYFGEYLDNADRGPMNVYKYLPGTDRATLAHTFAAREVRHIHGVYADPYTDSLWCVTGDGPSESRVIRTSDYFNSVETMGEGDESWRTVSMLFTNDAVTYASDAEFHENHIYRLNRLTGERTVLGEIDGPVYYSHAVGDDLFFAVTAELCPSQKHPNATLWHVSPDGKLERLYSAEKDLFQNKSLAGVFMPGTMHFPAGTANTGESYFHCVGLSGIDNRTLRLYHD
jgi:hypothetical protein